MSHEPYIQRAAQFLCATERGGAWAWIDRSSGRCFTCPSAMEMEDLGARLGDPYYGNDEEIYRSWLEAMHIEAED